MTVKFVAPRARLEKSDRKIPSKFKNKNTKPLIRKLTRFQMSVLIAESLFDAVLDHGHSFFPKEYLKK